MKLNDVEGVYLIFRYHKPYFPHIEEKTYYETIFSVWFVLYKMFIAGTDSLGSR